ncbi:MAG TPA: hypothetical protein PLD62_06380, partial [Candidatus Cloacimonadota bacterium]|nr:hypothetical protein [Candidatus Cloacimonadota bacterium]
MHDRINPTLTLAQLYENQNQLLDALVIYQKLQMRLPSDELQQKIDEIKSKVFEAKNLSFNPIIDQIFTLKDKKNFNILPHSSFRNFLLSQQVPQIESMQDIEESESEPLPSERTDLGLDEVFHEFEKEHPEEVEAASSAEKKTLEPAAEAPEAVALPEKKKITPLYDSDYREDLADDDFFNKPFEDIAQVFRSDQQKMNEKTEPEKMPEDELISTQTEEETEPENSEESYTSELTEEEFHNFLEEESAPQVHQNQEETSANPIEEKPLPIETSIHKADVPTDQTKLENLSFDELMARLDQKEVADKSQPEKKMAAPEEISVASEPADEDLTLEELEAELKAEFQRDRNQNMEEMEEEENVPTDIEPITGIEPIEEEAVTASQITPEILEGILSSNPNSADLHLPPLNPNEEEIPEKTPEKSLPTKQQNLAEPDDLSDLEFSDTAFQSHPEPVAKKKTI